MHEKYSEQHALLSAREVACRGESNLGGRHEAKQTVLVVHTNLNLRLSKK